MSHPTAQPAQETAREQAKKTFSAKAREKKKLVDATIMKGANGAEKVVNEHGPSAMKRAVFSKLSEGVRAVKTKVAEHDHASRLDRIADDELESDENILAGCSNVIAYFASQAAMLSALKKSLDDLSGCEFIQDTGHGKKVLAVASDLKAIAGTVESWRAKLEKQRAAYVAGPRTPKTQRKLSTQYFTMLTQINGLSLDLNKCQVKAATAIEFEAIKAVVVGSASKYKANQEDVEAAIVIVDQGIGAIDAAATAVADIPNEYAKGAAEATHIVLGIVQVIKSPLARLATSLAVQADMEEYRSTESSHQVYEDHNQDPLLLAALLKRKRVADTKQILDMIATPIINNIKDLTPVPSLIGTAWDATYAVVVATVTSYQDARIADARELLAAPLSDDEDVEVESAFDVVAGIAEAFGEDVLEGMAEQLKTSIFNALNPIGLMAAGLINALAIRIADLVVAALPRNPAQAIDGTALFNHIDGIVNAVQTYVQIAPPAVGPVCPSRTADGDTITLQLSEAEEVGTDHRWRVLLTGDAGAAGKQGYVYGSDARFEADTGSAPEDTPPAKDSRGIHLTTVFVEYRRSDVPGTVTYPAHAGTVRGDVTGTRVGSEITWVFTANRETPFVRSGGSWRDRIILRPEAGSTQGYKIKSTGTIVSGVWYRPTAESRSMVLITGNGLWEWASSVDSCGNTPTSHVGDVLDAHVQYGTDIEDLLVAHPH